MVVNKPLCHKQELICGNEKPTSLGDRQTDRKKERKKRKRERERERERERDFLKKNAKT